MMGLTRIKLTNFTLFKKLDIKPSPGINVFIGANGTGKTHLMKVAYAACEVSKTKRNFAEKLVLDFLPTGDDLGRLVTRQRGRSACEIEIYRSSLKLRMKFYNIQKGPFKGPIYGGKEWTENSVESVFIPVKEMLANAPGFRSLYSRREIHFEEIYADIVDRALINPLRGPIEPERKRLLGKLQKVIEGKVTFTGEEFFLSNKQGNLEFTLLAEGIRKLGLLWLLIRNGTLLKGSVLFWDEPETNLNPGIYGTLIDILLDLQRMGVQVFIATHDYVILKELDLRRKPDDTVMFYSFYHNRDREIEYGEADSYLKIDPNCIMETFDSLYDREIERNIPAGGKGGKGAGADG